jgi:hypothetical protein
MVLFLLVAKWTLCRVFQTTQPANRPPCANRPKVSKSWFRAVFKHWLALLAKIVVVVVWPKVVVVRVVKLLLSGLFLTKVANPTHTHTRDTHTHRTFAI